MADRRMLGRAVSQSRKVNSLSLKAALLWTWAIPWFDSHGYLEAEPDFIKFNILPRREDISLQEVPGLLQELAGSGLWKIYDYLDGSDKPKMIAFDPKFKDFQTLRHDRLGIPRYDPSLLREHSWTIPGIDGTAPDILHMKIREEKGREGMEGKPIFPPESIPYRLSRYLAKFIMENFPKHKPITEKDLQKWARPIDLMIRIDKREPDDIAKVIKWAQSNDFWKKNILSTEKLRKQFDNLVAQMGGL